MGMSEERLAQIRAMANWSWKGVVLELLAQVDALQGQVETGVAFHDLAVKERDRERIIVASLSNTCNTQSMTIAKLRGALAQYATHLPMCAEAGYHEIANCYCGLDAARTI